VKPLKPEQWAGLGLVLLAVIWIGYQGASRLTPNAGLTAPQKQPAPEDDLRAGNIGMTAADGYSKLCQPHEHHAGYVYTPHRYPRTTGGEITNLIHHGYAMMRVPNVDDVQWIISPPSEAAW
jgi:hypothetical protein